MKKVMIMVACTLLAGAINAASVAWNTGDASSLGWTGQAVSFYLCASGFSLGDDETGIIGAMVLNGKTSQPGGADYIGTIGSKGGNAAGNGATSSFGEGNVAYGWAVVFNAAGTQFAIFDVTASDTFPSAGNGGLTFSGAYTIYNVVPEPTAAALLVLGAAAVGLRRRFTK